MKNIRNDFLLKNIISVVLVAAMLAGVLLTCRVQLKKVPEEKTEPANEIEKPEEESDSEILNKEIEEIISANTVSFQNKILEDAVREQLGCDTPLSKAQVANIQELEIIVEESMSGDLVFCKEDLALLQNLKSLNIYNLRYKEIQRCIGFGHPDISGYENLKLLPDLRNLFIYDTSFNQLPEIAEIKSLRKLTLQSCTGSDLSPLEQMTDLEWVELEDMHLSDISPLLSLEKLKLLSLSYSTFTDDGVLEQLEDLEYLFLEGCDLTDISFVKNLKKLRRLELSSNELQNIDAVYELPRLNILRVMNNPLEDISKVGQMESLTVFWCDSNKIRDINAVDDIPVLEIYAEDFSTCCREEIKEAREVYDPEDNWDEEHRCKIETGCTGDFNGDGIEDLCMVVADYTGYSERQLWGRWLYIYPGSGKSYRSPLTPLKLDGEGEVPYDAVVMENGKVLLQKNGGDTRITYEYRYRNGKWKCILKNELTGYGNYFYGDYDYITRNYMEKTVQQYAILWEDPGYAAIKLAEVHGNVDQARLEDISVVKEEYDVRYSADWAMEKVLGEYFPDAEAEKIYYDKNECIENLKCLYGIARPDYEYLVHEDEGNYRIVFDSYDMGTNICKIAVYSDSNEETDYETRTIYEYDLKKGNITELDFFDTELIKADSANLAHMEDYLCVQKAMEAYDPTGTMINGVKGNITEVYAGYLEEEGDQILCLVVEWPDVQEPSTSLQRMLITYLREGNEFRKTSQNIELKWDRENDIKEEVYIEDGKLYLKYQTRDDAGDHYRNRIFKNIDGCWVFEDLQELNVYEGYISSGLPLSGTYSWKADSTDIRLDFQLMHQHVRKLGGTSRSYIVFADSSQLIGADEPFVVDPYPELSDFSRGYAEYGNTKEQEVYAAEALDIVAGRLFDQNDLHKQLYEERCLNAWKNITGIEIPDYYYEVETEAERSLLKYYRESKNGFVFAFVRDHAPVVYYEYNVKEDKVYQLDGENTNAG